MSTVTFENGKSVVFQGTPSPADIDEVAQKMGIQPTQSQGVTQKDIFPQGIGNFTRQAGTYGSGVSDAFSSGVNQVKEGYQQFKDAGANPIPMLEGAIKGGAGIINAATSPLAPFLSPIGQGVNAVSDQISNIPAVQNFANSPVGQVTARGAEDVANLSTIAGGVAGAMALGGVKPSVPGEQFTGRTVPPPPQGPDPRLIGVAKDWKAPVVSNIPKFNDAKIMVEKSPNIPSFLAEHGLNPFKNIEDGIYVTSDTASALRNTAGRMSADTLRPSLQAADFTTAKTTPSMILSSEDVPSATSRIQAQGRGVTADDSERIASVIQNKVEALQRKYPDGMSLTNMHDEKITYAQNGGFSPTNEPSVNNNAIANRSISATLADLVVKNAPEDVPVDQFNKYLSQYYKAADYLDELNNKKVPVSGLKQTVRMVTKFAGAKAATMLGAGGIGGGVISAFAGYQIAKALEFAAENMLNPMRDTFLRNMAIKNPEAFTQVSQYLENIEAQRAKTPLLMAPRPMGTTENPIVTSAPTTYESPAQQSNTTSFNPKTGDQYVRDVRSGFMKIIPRKK